MNQLLRPALPRACEPKRMIRSGSKRSTMVRTMPRTGYFFIGPFLF